VARVVGPEMAEHHAILPPSLRQCLGSACRLVRAATPVVAAGDSLHTPATDAYFRDFALCNGGAATFQLLSAALLARSVSRRVASRRRTASVALALETTSSVSAAPESGVPSESLGRREVLSTTGCCIATGAVAAAGPVSATPPARQAAKERLQLPNIGVGAWAWGDRLFWGYDEKQDADLRSGFEACINSGITLFDTAEIYGPGRSEELLGKFIRETGAKAQVATKFAAFPWKLERADVVKACKASLERLGMDSIDLYQIHFPCVWKNELYWDGLADCYEQGLVRAVGVSNYGSDAIRAVSARLQARGIPLTSNQIQYSLLYRFPELNGMKATCDELGVKILAYSPLGLGALTGKVSADSMPSGPRASIFGKLLEDPRWPMLVDAMREVAKQHGPDTTLSQVAIAWCIAKGTIPIPGVRNARQAQDDAKAAQLKLSVGEVEDLDAAASRVTPVLSPESSPFGSLRESLDTKQRLYEA